MHSAAGARLFALLTFISLPIALAHADADEPSLQSLQASTDAVRTSEPYDVRRFRGLYAEIGYRGLDSHFTFPCTAAMTLYGACGTARTNTTRFSGHTNHLGLTVGARLTPHLAVQVTGIEPKTDAFNGN